MIKSFMRWALVAIIGFAVSAPDSNAVEINLDEYPSYMRTRARLFNKATYNFGNPLSEEKDTIFFVDTALRVSPSLQLGDSVKIVVTADIADNVIWGGVTDQLLGGASTLVNSGISPSDSFRGSLLVPAWNSVAYLDGYSGGRPGDDSDNGAPSENSVVDKDAAWFDLRMAYAHIDLPNELGFVRIGRQTFDWGLGLVQNGGNDPSSDFGTLIDRLLLGKTGELDSGSTVTGMLFADIMAGGVGDDLSLRGESVSYQALGGAVIYNAPEENWGVDATLGAYIYPWIRHNDFAESDYFLGATGSLDRLSVYSLMMDLRRGDFRLAGEFHGAFGKISDVSGFKNCATADCGRNTAFNRNDNINIKHQVAWAGRLEFLPDGTVSRIGAEYGWIDGDKAGEYWNGGDDIEGGFVAFSPAYVVDSLLFRHILPTIYQSANNKFFSHTEAGIQNARYVRGYADFRLSDGVKWKNQWLAAWNNETDDVFVDGEKLASFIANEIETTFSFRLADGVFLDFTGSMVLPGTGLEEMFEAQAWNQLVRQSNDDIYFSDSVNGENYLGGQIPAGDTETRDLFAYFVDAEGAPTAGGISTAFQVDVRGPGTGGGAVDPVFVDASAAHAAAYEALRQEFANRYESERNRIWSLQTVLTVHLGGN